MPEIKKETEIKSPLALIPCNPADYPAQFVSEGRGDLRTKMLSPVHSYLFAAFPRCEADHFIVSSFCEKIPVLRFTFLKKKQPKMADMRCCVMES